MKRTAILLATLCLAACNRGGFSEYNHGADPRAAAAAQAKAKALKRADGKLTQAYYSPIMTVGKDGITRPEGAARTVRVTGDGSRALPPAQGSLTAAAAEGANAPVPKGTRMKPFSPEGPREVGAEENAAIMARIQADRDREMRATAKKDEIRNEKMRVAARPKPVPGQVRPTTSRPADTDADMTLPAPGNR